MSPTVFKAVSATNVINFQRSTNVFRDVVEQIYSIIDTQQDFIGRTRMRLLHFRMSYLLWMPRNSLITISTLQLYPTIPLYFIHLEVMRDISPPHIISPR